MVTTQPGATPAPPSPQRGPATAPNNSTNVNANSNNNGSFTSSMSMGTTSGTSAASPATTQHLTPSSASLAATARWSGRAYNNNNNRAGQHFQRRFHRWRSKLSVGVEHRREKLNDAMLMAFLRATALVHWMNENFILCANLVMLLLAFVQPPPIDLASLDHVFPYVLAPIYFMCGLVLPLDNAAIGPSRRNVVYAAFALGYVATPCMVLLIMLLWRPGFMWGLVTFFGLPPPMLSLVVFTYWAYGTVPLAVLFSVGGNIVMPLVEPVLLGVIGPTKRTAVSQAFPGSCCGLLMVPLALGCVAHGVLRAWRCRAVGTPKTTHSKLLVEASNMDADLTDPTSMRWGVQPRTQRVFSVLLLILNYFTFSGAFTLIHTPLGECLVCCALVLVVYIVVSALAWMLSGLPSWNLCVGDRIAFVFMVTHRTDFLTLPFVVHTAAFNDVTKAFAPDAEGLSRAVVMPVLCSYLIQTVFGSLMVFVLRRWRVRHHCGSGYAPLLLSVLGTPKGIEDDDCAPSTTRV
eukprot:PhM_4_TR3290/c0_g4_i1/m.86412